MKLEDFFLYTISVEVADDCWKIYNNMDWRAKKIIGDQFIRSIDSIAANIAEGFGRYYYLDKARFYYNARGSLLESKYWTNQITKRYSIDTKLIVSRLSLIHIQINKTINRTKEQKDNG